MRLKGAKIEISYKETQQFFKKRALKYNTDNPYSVTMYQDNNPELIKSRNCAETEKLLPLLKLNDASKVLDIACGIGRWSDAITTCVGEYCGIDFSEDLIKIAMDRNQENPTRKFLVGAANNVETVLKENGCGKYNRILLMGILIYLNDEEVKETFCQIEHLCEQKSLICIREPIGVTERLTLKEFYSEELDDNYSAIYRTRDEIKQIIDDVLVEKGFKILQEGFLFSEEGLNNRKETEQYFYLIGRE